MIATIWQAIKGFLQEYWALFIALSLVMSALYHISSEVGC